MQLWGISGKLYYQNLLCLILGPPTIHDIFHFRLVACMCDMKPQNFYF